eukprot:884570-Lingulodinium_polyedra.AAC.1
MTARRLQWKWPHYAVFVNEEGHHVDMRTVCPLDLKQAIAVAAGKVQWKAWADNSLMPELA